jgi:hypothetical protein
MTVAVPGACKGGIEWLPKNEILAPDTAPSGYGILSGLEQAIRNALERAERSNPEIRSRIYQSARNALDAGMRKQEIEDSETIDRQRQRLEITIRAIEDEELERQRSMARLEKVIIESTPEEQQEPEDTVGPEPVFDEPDPTPQVEAFRPDPVIEQTPPPPRREPPTASDNYAEEEDGSLSGLSAIRDERQAKNRKQARKAARKQGQVIREEEDPAWADPSTPEGRTVTPERRTRRRRKGSWLASLFVYSVLIGVVVAGIWWVYTTGMLDAALKGNSDFDLIPKELQSENFDPNEKNTRLDPLRGFSGDWVDVFKPNGKAQVTASGDAVIGNVTDSDGDAITIASNSPDKDGEVRIEVPAGILQDLAGKKSTLAITLRADGDKPAQIYIQCEFTTLGDCGRHRFTISSERVDELIPIAFEGKLGPTDPGHIVINSDLTGEGRAIRLYGIRVLPGS